MLKFYGFMKNTKFQTLSGKLTWSHYCELLSIDSIDKVNYYIKIVEDENLTVRELRKRIKSNEYERLDEETKKNLKDKEKLKVPDLVKNPIQIRKTNDYNEISEKILQKLILEDRPSFLKELGSGFCFIDNEYKITLELEENLEEEEIKQFVKQNKETRPKSLLDFVNNFKKIRDLNRCSYIHISSNNKDGIIGEISIKNGILEKYNINESFGNFNLSMVKNGSIINTESARIDGINSKKEQILVENLPSDLYSTYKEGIQFVKKYK